MPARGPQKALGLIVWNPEANGRDFANAVPPPTGLEFLVARGWDILAMNRNPTWERFKTPSGGSTTWSSQPSRRGRLAENSPSNQGITLKRTEHELSACATERKWYTPFLSAPDCIDQGAME